MAVEAYSHTISGNKAKAVLHADTKADVTEDLVIDGMPLAFGSLAITKSFEVGMLGSDGHWSWKE